MRRRIERLFRSGLRLPRRLAHAARVALDILRWCATFQLAAGLRRRRHARLLRRSPLFDVHHYLSQCEGDDEARRDPVMHYLTVGAARGLDPSPLFDTTAYVEQHPGAAGENPLVHYLLSSRARGGVRPDVPDPDPQAVRDADALLRRTPFRAPCVGGVQGDVFVAVPDGGAADEAAPGRLAARVEMARRIGRVVLVRGAAAEGDDGPALDGVTVVRGAPAALAHLEIDGHRCRAVLALGGEQAERWLAPARAYAPWATFVYDAAGDAERLGGAERVSAACADVVLVATARERECVQRAVPAARVELVADLADGLAELVAGPSGPAGAPPCSGSAA